MPDHRYPLMINGVPVVETSEEIDICNAEQLRIVLLEAGSRGHATVAVDLTRTRFCDSSGLTCWPERTSGPWPTAAGCGWSSPTAATSCGPSP